MGAAPIPIAADCKMSPDATGQADFVSKPGSVTLELVSTSGSVNFGAPTDVTDATGNSIGPQKTATTLQFTVSAGQTYSLIAAYLFFPPTSTGRLQEKCSAGVVLSPVGPINNPQQFRIRGTSS